MSPTLAALALVPSLFAHFQAPKVSLDARGQDVREVFATLFAQAKKPYALDASLKGTLYIKLDGMEYDKALKIVLSRSGLVAKEEDGVVIVSPPSVPAPKPAPRAAKPVVGSKPFTLVVKTPLSVAKPPLAPVVTIRDILDRKVTTRLNKAPLAMVFASLAKQADAQIAVDASVPPYLMDANFSNLTLSEALHKVCAAAGLKIRTTGTKIAIFGKSH